MSEMFKFCCVLWGKSQPVTFVLLDLNSKWEDMHTYCTSSRFGFDRRLKITLEFTVSCKKSSRQKSLAGVENSLVAFPFIPECQPALTCSIRWSWAVTHCERRHEWDNYSNTLHQISQVEKSGCVLTYLAASQVKVIELELKRLDDNMQLTATFFWGGTGPREHVEALGILLL